MKANHPKLPSGWLALRTKLAAAVDALQRLPVPLFLALSLAATLAWVVFLCWAAFNIVLLLMG
ncbi:hypothetical protein ASF41_23070 [Methylobacterium sp. Leaf111]|uniref:hypothetical protein n=1 Tax=Methylobacterium sp. Leaf111 TaxID=1736257 RepID=UPI0006F4625F|nr:hypothetical protein [Methylobacterium sp. Leaf111]KQP58139.1 hypothetical protein ASF41_23070 [Methylobacterium sp. Leaf111]